MLPPMSPPPSTAPSPGPTLTEHLRHLSLALRGAATDSEVLQAGLDTALVLGSGWASAEVLAQKQLPLTVVRSSKSPIDPAHLAERRQHLLAGAAAYKTAHFSKSQTHVAAALPLMLSQRQGGLLTAEFHREQPLSSDERSFLEVLAAQCSLALERLELQRQLSAERRERAQGKAPQEQVQVRTQELEVRNRALEAFELLSRELTLEKDPYLLVQRAQAIVLALLPAGVATYYELEGDIWVLKVQTGDLRLPALQAMLDAGLPYREADNLRLPLETRRGYYQAAYDVHTDRRPEETAHIGSSVTLPVLVHGVVRGIFGLGLFGEPRAWSGADRSMLESVVRSLGLALERAESMAQLETRNVQLAEEARAQAAFMAFSEAVGTQTDVLTLIDLAIKTLGARFGECSGGYYQREGQLWKLQVWTEDLNANPALLGAMRAGVPSDTPAIRDLLAKPELTFKEDWDPEREVVEHSQEYGAIGLYPLILQGEMQGMLSIGLKRRRRWTDADRATLRAVGRGLDLAIERVEQTKRLEMQNAELDARSQALEAFADLARDLTTSSDPYALIKRAQEVVLSLLPGGYSIYWELEGGLWRARTQVGELRNDALQRSVDAGLPSNETSSFDLPWRTRQPLFQEVYAQDRDTDPALVQHVQAAATLPLLVAGQPMGVLGVGLFEQRRWTDTDKAALAGVMHSLGLAIERVQGARALSAVQQQLKVVLDHAPLMLFATDAQGTVTLSEGRGLTLVGLQPGEVVGRSALEMYREVPQMYAAFERALAGENTHLNQELSGQVFECWFVSVHDASGQVTGCVGVAIDITENARAEQALQRALRFNELILSNIGEGLVGVDRQGRNTFANPAALNLLGYRAEEFLGAEQHALIHHSHADKSPYPRGECPIYAAFTDGQVHTVANEVFWRRDGTPLPVEYTSTPIRNEWGEIEGAVLSFRDVTLRREAQRALMQTNAELRRSNAELEQFAYVASHDLQEPLRSVSSFSQLLVSRFGQDDPKARTYAGFVNEGVERMSQLIQDLLAYSRVATDTADFRVVPSKLITAQVLQDLRAQIEASGAQIRLGELPDVLGNPTQIRQLLQNLIGNAIKFRDPGRPPIIELDAATEGDEVRFSLQDNGVGIKPEYFERIFVIFQRLHTRERYQGNGIGLSIAKKIVERHGGTITLNSQEGHGTTFTFTLPEAHTNPAYLEARLRLPQ